MVQQRALAARVERHVAAVAGQRPIDPDRAAGNCQISAAQVALAADPDRIAGRHVDREIQGGRRLDGLDLNRIRGACLVSIVSTVKERGDDDNSTCAVLLEAMVRPLPPDGLPTCSESPATLSTSETLRVGTASWMRPMPEYVIVSAALEGPLPWS